MERLRLRDSGEQSGRTRPRPERRGATPASVALLALQRSAGNAAIAEMLQRDATHAPAAPARSTGVDDQAKAIIQAAQSQTPGENERAVGAIWAILDTYYPDKKEMIKDVRWNEPEDGLRTKIRGTSARVRGIIFVGHDFISHTTEGHFARRVLQVGHELEHVQQHRNGMAGDESKAEREFLAFYHEVTATPMQGTGEIDPGTKLRLVNGAIGYYNQLSDAKKRQYAAEYEQLTAMRDRRPR